ncbi:hypothetical protein [Actinacidiphila sp. bgisy144]|uniref:hypothetical protein n=1 Tax=Actinacidiphila sp. bgisy144 TaxID=3413791 RepID=UPI003EBDE996
MTELGRAQSEIAYFNFTTHPTHRNNPSSLDPARRQANEIITGCCEAADEILESVAADLRTSAGRLAPSTAHVQATARSPHTSLVGQSAPAPAAPPAPAASPLAPSAVKGR